MVDERYSLRNIYRRSHGLQFSFNYPRLAYYSINDVVRLSGVRSGRHGQRHFGTSRLARLITAQIEQLNSFGSVITTTYFEAGIFDCRVRNSYLNNDLFYSFDQLVCLNNLALYNSRYIRSDYLALQVIESVRREVSVPPLYWASFAQNSRRTAEVIMQPSCYICFSANQVLIYKDSSKTKG